MFLDDIGKKPVAKFKKINRYLKENHGIMLSAKLDDKEITSAFNQIHEEITQLKMNGETSLTSVEISKRLLVLEGLKSLKEAAISTSPEYQSVLRNLVDYVVGEVSLEYTGHNHPEFNDIFDETVRNAMREYRSSKYRFPDDVVERELRSEAKFQLKRDGHENMVDEGIDDLSLEPMTPPAPRKHGSKSGKDDIWAGQPGVSDKYDLSSAPFEPDMVLDRRTGKLVPNPFAAKKTELRGKGYMGEDEFDAKDKLANHRRAKSQAVTHPATHKPELAPGKSINPRTGEEVVDPFTAHKMKQRGTSTMQESENLVKRLRYLLETEVDQAEVMMAAKGFAQELQEMVEKIGRLQNEDLPPVTDQMRQTYGTDSASAFQSQIYAALQGVMDALYTAKSQVDAAVDSMASTGQVGAQVDMDVDMSDDMEGDDLSMDDLGADLEAAAAEDDFGAAETEEPLGRAQKESIAMQKKVLEMQKLVARAKALKESKKK